MCSLWQIRMGKVKIILFLIVSEKGTFLYGGQWKRCLKITGQSKGPYFTRSEIGVSI